MKRSRMQLHHAFYCLVALTTAGCPARTAQHDPLAPPPGSSIQNNPRRTPDFEGVGPNAPGTPIRNDNDHNHVAETMPHSFEDAARWSQRFDAAERDAWQLPDLVVEKTLATVPREDVTLVDLGAGTGYFTVRFAKALPRGTVVAADIQSSLLHWTARRATEAGVSNVTTHQTTASGPDWPTTMAKADIVFLSNVYHHIEGRPGWFSAVRDMTQPDGALVVVDFTPASKRGPPPAHKLAPEVVVTELKEAGWRLDATYDFLPDQYFLVFRKSP